MITYFRKTENAHILLWLIKDTCWLSNWKIPGLIMILPTLFVAIYLAWKLRSDKAELAHNTAICFWISANSTWMIGEFFFEDSIRPLALVFFIAGLSVITFYYIHLLTGKKKTNNSSEE